MLKETVVFLTLISVAFAALAIAPLEPKPEKFKDEEGCYIKELDEVIPIGKSAPSKKSCMEYRCRETDVQLASCGKVAAVPPCYTVEDTSQPYPGCCETIVCDECE